MALFTFTAVRQDGTKFSGEREADDKHALVEALRAEGATALTADVARSRSHFRASASPTPTGDTEIAAGAARRGSIFSAQLSLSFIFGVPNSEKILFARNLSAMITAGLPLSRALTILERQTKNTAMKETITALGEDVRQGHALHDALAAHPKVFSKLFVAMARAGEESGTLAASLQVVATQMDRSYTLTKKVRGAMIYPSVVLCAMVVIGILMLIYVVPTLSSTFASLNTALPLPTQIIIFISDALIAHTVSIAAAAIVLILALVAALRSRIGKLIADRGVLAMPIIGSIIARINAARTARTLSSLLSSGVSALSALEITGQVVQNTRFQPVIAEARESVEKGKPISDAFVRAEHIYPVMFSEMAAVGEETGDLPGMLARVAEFYEDEVEQETKDLSTVIEPLLMLVIGAGVGFFAVAMIMPIYSLSSSM